MQQQIQDFQRHLRLALVIPLLLAAILGTIFALQTFYLSRSMEQVDHSYQVQMRSRTALRLMLDMETGLRGYLLTGEERFLEPFRQSAPQVEPLLNELAALVQNDPQQTALVESMRDEYQKWHLFSSHMIGLRQKSGPFNDVSLNMQGKEIMDRIRAARDQFVRIEEQRLSERIGNVQQTTRNLLLMGIVLSLLMGIFWATFSRRELHVVARSYNKALQTAFSRTDEFHQSQRWLGGVLSSIGDGVIATDIDGRIAFSNAVANKLLQLPEDSSSVNAATLQIVDEYSREPFPNPFTFVKQSGQLYAQRQHTMLIRPDTTEVPVSLVASPLRDDNGVLTGVVAVIHDMTEQRQSQRTLQSAEKMASIGRIAASVAHEIHNPLDAIGNLLYLLENGNLDPTSKTYVRLAQEELERVASISEQMLTFSRESRQPVPVSLSEVLDNVLMLFSARIRRMEVVVVKNYDSQISIKGYPGEMRQVFSNLIGNALDAMNGPGRLLIRTELSHAWSKKGEPGVRVLICDTGSGIPPEVRPNLMDPFVTSKGEKGTGLGLWVCRGIVEKYHGNLRYHTSTTPGRSGTCFSVFLPAVQGGDTLVSSKSRETEKRAS